MKEFFTKLVRSRYSIVFLILFIAFLYFLQEKLITPLVMEVVKSDAFFEKPVEEDEPLGKVEGNRPRIGFGLSHCKEAIKKEGNLPDGAEFLDQKHEAWALGNRHYIIRSVIRIIDPEKGQQERLFACKIRMIGDNEADAASWSVLGIDFNEPSQSN